MKIIGILVAIGMLLLGILCITDNQILLAIVSFGSCVSAICGTIGMGYGDTNEHNIKNLENQIQLLKSRIEKLEEHK